ncbi:hypothetical protein [[Pseudopropionibacterium] massiliense]|uniref:hypothetical protein n=1 Tax=[Pseudopropionibacterium] massiliense TaxID=2220000 RepID=UPI001031AEBF|nr:hypothetical protein [[Pseudopropionibacterium] massiliense]
MQKPVKVTFVVPAFNAGDTTRGIETARAIQRVAAQRGREVEISFIYPQTEQSFAEQIAEGGYGTRTAGLTLSQRRSMPSCAPTTTEPNSWSIGNDPEK